MDEDRLKSSEFHKICRKFRYRMKIPTPRYQKPRVCMPEDPFATLGSMLSHGLDSLPPQMLDSVHVLCDMCPKYPKYPGSTTEPPIGSFPNRRRPGPPGAPGFGGGNAPGFGGGIAPGFGGGSAPGFGEPKPPGFGEPKPPGFGEPNPPGFGGGDDFWGEGEPHPPAGLGEPVFGKEELILPPGGMPMTGKGTGVFQEEELFLPPPRIFGKGEPTFGEVGAAMGTGPGLFGPAPQPPGYDPNSMGFAPGEFHPNKLPQPDGKQPMPHKDQPKGPFNEGPINNIANGKGQFMGKGRGMIRNAENPIDDEPPNRMRVMKTRRMPVPE